jgi:hypothetical protein
MGSYCPGLVSLNDPKLVRLKGTKALLLGVVVVPGRRNVSSQIMKISASILPSSRSNWFSGVGSIAGLVQSRCDQQHVLRL